MASDPSTSIEILKELSIDKEWNVRYCVALNKNTPKDILRILSKDKNNWVRYEAALNMAVRSSKCKT